MSPCLFNLYAEYIVQNAELVEAQARIKIARMNINNLSYADDSTLMAESEGELKSLLMKVKKRVKKHDIQKTKISPASQTSQLSGRIGLRAHGGRRLGCSAGWPFCQGLCLVPSLVSETG